MKFNFDVDTTESTGSFYIQAPAVELVSIKEVEIIESKKGSFGIKPVLQTSDGKIGFMTNNAFWTSEKAIEAKFGFTRTFIYLAEKLGIEQELKNKLSESTADYNTREAAEELKNIVEELFTGKTFHCLFGGEAYYKKKNDGTYAKYITPIVALGTFARSEDEGEEELKDLLDKRGEQLIKDEGEPTDIPVNMENMDFPTVAPPEPEMPF